jgi:uncharacterized protein
MTHNIRFDPMKLRVDQITPEAAECTLCSPVDEINRRLASGEVRDFRFVSPLDVHLSYYRAGDDLYFSGGLDGVVEGMCARCLEPFSFRIDSPFELVLTPEVKAASVEELSAEDLALSFYSGDEIDLAPLISEQAILALPSRALCREDCRGLCPQCGANRNDESCSCETTHADPRLAVLRTLRARGTS